MVQCYTLHCISEKLHQHVSAWYSVTHCTAFHCTSLRGGVLYTALCSQQVTSTAPHCRVLCYTLHCIISLIITARLSARHYSSLAPPSTAMHTQLGTRLRHCTVLTTPQYHYSTALHCTPNNPLFFTARCYALHFTSTALHSIALAE